MSISRRKFLKVSTVVSISAAIPLRVSAQQGRGSLGNVDNDPADLSFPTKAQFSEYLNTTFWITLGASNTLEVELVAVNELKQSATAKEPAGAKRERFSLIFKGPQNKPLTQDTYTIKHHNLGTLLMFLVPMGIDKKGTGMRYEAIVSRLSS